MSSTESLSGTLDDWKLIYRVLHARLSDHLELLDCEVLQALQDRLQSIATAEGVDVGHHAAWDQWLGNQDTPSCEERMPGRRGLGDSADDG